MPIEYIKIQNFLSYDDITIPFHPGVNAIIGDSDSGKSAIIKALDWVVNNKPSGDEFVRWNSKTPTIVEIGIDGKKIIRARNKSTNTYQIDNGEPYEAFGQGVPEDIRKIFNMQSVNIHRQIDKPFLLSESPGHIAQFVNNIANLDSMQQSIINADKAVRSKVRIISTEKDNLITKQNEEKEFDWVDKADGYLAELKKLQTKNNLLRSNIAKIKTLIGQIKNKESQSRQYDWLKSAIEKLNIYLDINKQLFLRYDIARQLKSIIKNINNTQKQLNKLPPAEAKEKIDNLLKLDYNIKKGNKKYNALFDLIEQIENIEKNIEQNKKELTINQKQFDKLMPDVCPLCRRR